MNLRQERLLSRRSQLGRERFKCWNAWCSWHRQRHERGRYRCVALSLFTDPAVHHVRVQAMRQGHTTDAGPRLGTQGKYLCLELLAVFTPAWAVLIQRLFHRLHDPPSWGRCPLHAGSSRWDRRALTQVPHLALVGSIRFSLQAIWEWEQNHSTVGRPPEPKAPRPPDTEPEPAPLSRVPRWHELARELDREQFDSVQ